jgi:hypothetical protein
MSIVITTLSVAVGEADGTVSLTSATGVTNPGANKTTRTNLWVDRECMEVTAVSGTVISVVRGTNGTRQRPHPIGSKVWAGAEADFRAFTNDGLGLGLYSSLSRAFETTTPTTAADTATLTEAQLLGGLITGTPTAAANYTLPTPALLIAALQAFSEPYIGMTFYFTIKNTSAGANTITAVGPTGATVTGTATIAQNSAKRFRVVITGVDAPAYTVYSEGTSVF